MLEIVGGRDRGSWGILRRLFFRRRIDPNRLGHRRRFRRSVDEASGVPAKSLGQNSASMVEQARSLTVVNDRGSHQTDRAVVMFVVVPGEQLAADREGVFEGTESVGLRTTRERASGSNVGAQPSPDGTSLFV